MGLKELKNLKNDLTNQLQVSLGELIAGPEISVTISDDLERIVIILTTNKQHKETLSTNLTENILIYHIKDQQNMTFQGSGKTVVYKNGAVNGFSSEHGQIDLTTLFMLQQFVYNFCVENELIESQDKETDTAVGEEELSA